MTPLQQLYELYESQPTARPLEDDITLHLYNGYLISTPTYIAMGKEIVHWMSDEEVRDPRCQIPKGAIPDAWYVYAMSGSACDFLSFMPYFLPSVAWHRRGNLRYYDTHKFNAKCKSMIPFLTRSFSSAVLPFLGAEKSHPPHR